MRIFSFDADSQGIHLCLMEDGTVVAEKTIASANSDRQEIAASLLPAIASSLTEAMWNKRSLGAVVVGCGPGSFTGIRVAVTVARMLAYALKLPLIGLSRFEVIASCFEGAVGVILSAYRDFCYMSVLEIAGNEQSSQSPQCAVLPGAFCVHPVFSKKLPEAQAHLANNYGQTQFIMEPRCVALSELAQSLNLAKQDTNCFVAEPAVQASATGLSFDPEILSLPAIGNPAVRQAEIAWNRLSLKTGNLNDVVADDFPWKFVEPLYLREPSVTLKQS